VLQDIVDQLGLGQGKQLQRWVMGFGRTNLHLSVQQKAASAAACLQPLLAEAAQQHAAGRRLAATLVYVQSTKQADELQALLEAAGVAAAK
jgi:superfamily II DNA helicase RecQ